MRLFCRPAQCRVGRHVQINGQNKYLYPGKHRTGHRCKIPSTIRGCSIPRIVDYSLKTGFNSARKFNEIKLYYSIHSTLKTFELNKICEVNLLT